MSQSTSYRMNSLAEPGSFVRPGVGHGSSHGPGHGPGHGSPHSPGHGSSHGAQHGPGHGSPHGGVGRSAERSTLAHGAASARGSGGGQVAPLGAPALSPALRGGSVAPFAVRNNLRTPPLNSALLGLQRWLGITLTAMAWLVFLWGMAHLVIAAVHNAGGELGQSIDATVRGAKCCLGAFLLALVGLPQWLVSQRKLDHVRLQRN